MTPFTYTMTTMSFRCSMLAGNPVQTRLQVFDLFLAARATGRRTNREEYQLEPCHYSWLKCLRKRKRGTPGERGGGRGDYSQSQVSTFAFLFAIVQPEVNLHMVAEPCGASRAEHSHYRLFQVDFVVTHFP